MNKQLKISLIIIALLGVSVITVNAGIPEEKNSVLTYLEKIHYTVGNIWLKVLNIQTRVGDLQEAVDAQGVRYEVNILQDIYQDVDTSAIAYGLQIRCDKPYELADV